VKKFKKNFGKDRKKFENVLGSLDFFQIFYFIVMPHAQNASPGFALRTYRFHGHVQNLAQTRPDEASRRLPAKQGGGGIATGIQMN